jgi:hypothetical protein
MKMCSFLCWLVCVYMQSCGMPSELDAPEYGGDGYHGRVPCDGRTDGTSMYDLINRFVDRLAFHISSLGCVAFRCKIYFSSIDDFTTYNPHHDQQGDLQRPKRRIVSSGDLWRLLSQEGRVMDE